MSTYHGEGNPQTAHKAVVTATSPLTVKPVGSSTSVPARRLGSYAPVVNDLVAYVTYDGDILVLGKPQ